jgi:nucleoside-diphosphate-sugar epimerase
VDRLCASNDKARRLLGWTPGVSLEEGLRRTIDWIASHRGFYTTEAYHR